MEYRVDYASRPYGYNPPSYVPPGYRAPPGHKPHPAQPVHQSTTTTTTTRKPYAPPTMKPLLSATFSPPTMPASDHTEKVVQGLPHRDVKRYKVNLVNYEHPYPKHTTEYPVTKQHPSYSANGGGSPYPTTAAYTTTTTHERPPSPEYHMPV